ncbi:hypothetical protein [Bacillus cereus]|uniref:hypothetical protein n=1 Tax=Bacillus cereus group TaxID=86661 RepID=UPI0007B6EB1C|nr:hypothetical protein [Bacillus cereus]ANC11074.1 hypothetical protein WR47_28595 [Bacillus cereus]ANC17162.1 hypothetical protein WR51_30075 [Bacillus cereus]MDA1997232.1 hypothetical protein [Bacillus cereus]MDA2003079.1 hypothetical protein [Bacillus cereus]
MFYSVGDGNLAASKCTNAISFKVLRETGRLNAKISTVFPPNKLRIAETVIVLTSGASIGTDSVSTATALPFTQIFRFVPLVVAPD